MTFTRPTPFGRVMIAFFLLGLSCREADAPLAPTLSGSVAQGEEDPSVTSVVPNRVNPGATVDVTVHGSGFDPGSLVSLERGGVPADGISTNATTYVSATQLIANITIAATVDTGRYDVAVTTSGGRKGVGIELLAVEYALEELVFLGSGRSRAHAVNDRGEVVGDQCVGLCVQGAFYWSLETGVEALPNLPGYTRSTAAAINQRGQVFGVLECYMGDPECGGQFLSQSVRWEKLNGSWVLTRLDGCSVINPAGDQSRRFLINNRDQCVKRVSGSLVIQTLSGGTIAAQEVIPRPGAEASLQASSINDVPMIAGQVFTTFIDPTVWYRNLAGVWTAIQLGFPGRDDWGWAYDISEPDASGRVLVSGTTMDVHHRGTQHAVRWTLEPDGNGGWRVASLEQLPTAGYGSFFRGAFGTAINRAGQIVGTSGGTVESGLPVLWPSAGGIQTLPIPSRGGGGQGGGGRAADINSHGLIVGAVWDDPTLGDRAAVWRLR